MLGTQDLLVILIIVIVLFGRKRIPDIVKGIREGIKNYKKSMSEPDEINVTTKAHKDNKEGQESRK